MEYPKPFDLDLEMFLKGSTVKEIVIDPIFGKPFKKLYAEIQKDDPDGLIADFHADDIPSFPDKRFFYRYVPAGILLYSPQGLPIGGYLGCDLSVSPEYQGRGFGAEIVMSRCIGDLANPVWNLDKPAYTPAGLAAHKSAWRLVRSLFDGT